VYIGHFAEYRGHSTRQKRNIWALVKILCRVPGSTRQRSKLCRVPPRVLGKETEKGARWWPFAKCRLSYTRQRGNLFAECIRRHSVNVSSPLPGAVTAAFLYRVPSDTRQSLCRVPDKSTRQRSHCRCTVRRALFVECYTRQRIRRVFFRLCRVLQTLDKDPNSGSVYYIVSCTYKID
jgi:hypothetical protein